MFPLRVRAYHPRPPLVRRAVAKPNKIFHHELDAEPNTAFIKVGANQDFLRSPAEALALIRDVERRFGLVQDFQFRRDYDQNTRYQSIVRVVFKDPATLQLLPSVPTTFAFKRPSVDHSRPGGIGLEDLKPFLQPQLSERTSSSDASPGVSESEGSAPDENTLSYTVDCAKSNLISPSMFTKATEVSSMTARLFLEWGGFHSLKPISSETELSIEKVFRPTSIDHFRMRCALRRYSEMSAVPNPYEKAPGQELETALQEQDPLQISNPENASQDSPMPSDVLVESQMPDVSASSDAPTLHIPPSSNASTTSSSSTQHEPDTTSSSPALESSPPSAQSEAPVREPVTTSPSPVPPPSPAQPSTTLPESVAKAEATATKMHQQAKSMNRAKQKKEQKRKEKEANPLPDLSKKKKPAQPSMRNVTGSIEARQAADAKRTTVEKPKTIREKISGLFSGLF